MEKELLDEKEKLYTSEDLVGKGGKFLVLTANDSTVYCREKFTEEQKMIANSALDFARKQIKPVSERLNKTLDEDIKVSKAQAESISLLKAQVEGLSVAVRTLEEDNKNPLAN